MKNRNGFVSNSSSASFVVHWRFRSFGEEVSEEDVFRSLEIEDAAKNLVREKSERNGDGTFTTRFFTAMMNTYSDFGSAAGDFVLALTLDKNFAVIDTRIDDDGDYF